MGGGHSTMSVTVHERRQEVSNHTQERLQASRNNVNHIVQQLEQLNLTVNEHSNISSLRTNVLNTINDNQQQLSSNQSAILTSQAQYVQQQNLQQNNTQNLTAIQQENRQLAREVHTATINDLNIVEQINIQQSMQATMLRAVQDHQLVNTVHLNSEMLLLSHLEQPEMEQSNLLNNFINILSNTSAELLQPLKYLIAINAAVTVYTNRAILHIHNREFIFDSKLGSILHFLLKYCPDIENFVNLNSFRDVLASFYKETKDTLLHLAVKHYDVYHKYLIDFLLDRGSNINQCKQNISDNITPVFYANTCNILDFLLYRGADIKSGNIPSRLMNSAIYLKYNEKLIYFYKLNNAAGSCCEMTTADFEMYTTSQEVCKLLKYIDIDKILYKMSNDFYPYDNISHPNNISESSSLQFCDRYREYKPYNLSIKQTWYYVLVNRFRRLEPNVTLFLLNQHKDDKAFQEAFTSHYIGEASPYGGQIKCLLPFIRQGVQLPISEKNSIDLFKGTVLGLNDLLNNYSYNMQSFFYLYYIINKGININTLIPTETHGVSTNILLWPGIFYSSPSVALNYNILNILIENEIDVNCVNELGQNCGWSIISSLPCTHQDCGHHIHSQNEHVDIASRKLQILVKAGLILNITDNQGDTLYSALSQFAMTIFSSWRGYSHKINKYITEDVFKIFDILKDNGVEYGSNNLLVILIESTIRNIPFKIKVVEYDDKTLYLDFYNEFLHKIAILSSEKHAAIALNYAIFYRSAYSIKALMLYINNDEMFTSDCEFKFNTAVSNLWRPDCNYLDVTCSDDEVMKILIFSSIIKGKTLPIELHKFIDLAKQDLSKDQYITNEHFLKICSALEAHPERNEVFNYKSPLYCADSICESIHKLLGEELFVYW